MKSGEHGLVGPGSNNYGKDEKSTAQPLKIPTCGRMVHYFPVVPDTIEKMQPVYCKCLPAIVVEASDPLANLVVFGMGSTPSESKYSVPHKSTVHAKEDGTPAVSYWDWPEIK